MARVKDFYCINCKYRFEAAKENCEQVHCPKCHDGKQVVGAKHPLARKTA